MSWGWGGLREGLADSRLDRGQQRGLIAVAVTVLLQDAGFLYVLFKNMEDCQKSGDEATLRVLSHLHTRVQACVAGSDTNASCLCLCMCAVPMECVPRRT
eukprot:6175660-Pleurochrysis_carterae.AAC.5